jgi:hypothetical protein
MNILIDRPIEIENAVCHALLGFARQWKMNDKSIKFLSPFLYNNSLEQ